MTIVRASALALLAMLCVETARADILGEAAGKYTIEPSSSINFKVGQVGGGGINGVFGKFSGVFTISDKGVSQSDVVFTLFPESVATKDSRIENFLRSSAVFDSAKFPKVTFRSTSVKQVNATTAKIEGLLTARGITKPASFTASLSNRNGRQIDFHVLGSISRAPYGMDVGTPIYSNVVQFDMKLVGRR
ncbi:MAG: YceI family protein [Rhizobiaceae bacterium]